MIRRCVVLVLLSLLPAAVGAQASNDSTMTAEEFLSSLNPTSGKVTVGKNLATLDVPESFRFPHEDP